MVGTWPAHADGTSESMAYDSRALDILELIDRLETMVTARRHLFMSSRVMIEESEFLEIVDQLRLAIPAEIQFARRVLQDRQKVILDAQTEAEKIIATAKDRAEYLISDNGVTAEAKYRSEDYVRERRDEARRLMREAELFVRERLDHVERAIHDSLTQIEQAKGTIAPQQ